MEGGEMDLLEASKLLASLAEEEVRALNVPVTVAVTDAHGNLVLNHRMDGASLISIEMAERKAYTAVALRMKTADIAPLACPGGSLQTITSVAGDRVMVGRQLIFGVGINGGAKRTPPWLRPRRTDLPRRSAAKPRWHGKCLNG
jgi:uncharacterized protein GlcG (DUF336 family)